MLSQKRLLIIAILVFCLGVTRADFNKSVITQPYFSQSVIDLAMSNKPVSYKNSEGSAPSVVKAAQAFYYLTLVASINPEAAASNGKKVKDQVIATFRYLVSGGNEPHCSNPLYGWSDGPVALSLILIKSTPSLWNSLNQEEHAKADWLMKALAIAGSWAFNDANNYKTGLGNGGNFGKGNNPNYIQGYMGVMIAFSLYFGPDAGNKILTSFDYDTYINQFKAYSWTGILANWGKTGKKRMEEGGSDGRGGNGKGVKLVFKWNGLGLDDLNGIFYSQSVKGSPKPMYGRTVIDSVGPAYIVSGSSPVLGKLGMCLEFNSTDQKGLRSDALYALEGLMNNLITRATMKRLKLWDGPKTAEVENLMKIGVTDLFYKLSKGYVGINVHGTRLINDKPGGEADQKGLSFHKDIWANYINK